jgi:hypothetical protein
MKLHLNYDHYNENGVIFNELYPQGVGYIGVEHKPVMPFEYASFGYTEVFANMPPYVIDVGSDRRRLATDDEIAAIKAAALAWVQPYGQEGNETPEQKAEFIRAERDMLIAQTDWWELPSQAPISNEREAYRQALRDITSQAGFPESINWPTKP